MAPIFSAFDSVHLYMSDFASRIVAKTGIPGDRFHLGKLILQGLHDDPCFDMQIDGATGVFDTNKSVLERTVKCAISLQKLGLKQGDVLAVIAPNHVNICIPIYAALSLGIIAAPLDLTLGARELTGYFLNIEPKIIFCQCKKTAVVKQALEDTSLNPTIITFDKGDDYTTFYEFIEQYNNESAIKEFRPVDLDPETTVAYLTTTSGSAGVPKVVALSHKNLAISIPYTWTNFTTFPTPTKLVLVTSSAHWISAGFNILFSPIMKYTRLQSSEPATPDMIIRLINKFKPTYAVFSPTLMATLLKKENRENCDFSCFDFIKLGGGVVAPELLKEVKEVSPRTRVTAVYGQSEIGGFPIQDGTQARGSLGRPNGAFDCRLVRIDTLEDIDEPYVNGELWLKGPTVFMGYYNNPKETEATIVEGGWMRTGDILYRDEEGQLYFVDKIKLLMKYKNYHVSPTEVEAVIRQHNGVLDVAVTSIDDWECGDLAVACVVPKQGFKVTAEEIKDLVKGNLSEPKQLYGGVIFLDELPTTSTSKIHRTQLKEMVRNLPRE